MSLLVLSLSLVVLKETLMLQVKVILKDLRLLPALIVFSNCNWANRVNTVLLFFEPILFPLKIHIKNIV